MVLALWTPPELCYYLELGIINNNYGNIGMTGELGYIIYQYYTRSYVKYVDHKRCFYAINVKLCCSQYIVLLRAFAKSPSCACVVSSCAASWLRRNRA